MDQTINLATAIVSVIGSILGGLAVFTAGLLTMGRKFQILDDLQSDMAKVKHNLKVITLALTKSEVNFDANEIQSLSPAELTDKGQNLIQLLHFDATIQEHSKEFFKCIEEDHPKFKYDIELAAIKCIYSLFDRPFMSALKIYLYHHPERNLENIAPTLGIYLRDQYLRAHPEITV